MRLSGKIRIENRHILASKIWWPYDGRSAVLKREEITLGGRQMELTNNADGSQVYALSTA